MALNALLTGPEARQGYHLGQALSHLEHLLALARWRRRWTAAEHDAATSLCRQIYALGLLTEPAPMDQATADQILARVRALANSRQMLLEDPRDYVDELEDLAEQILNAAGEPDIGQDLDR